MTATLDPRLRSLEAQFSASSLTQILDEEFAAYGVELWLKRDDLLHPIISGNKWRKLKYVLDHVLQIGSGTIISMGGAHSNHLHALAYAGNRLNVKTIAYVRSEQPESGNSTLFDLQTWGMELRFVSRSEYRHLRDYKNHDSLPGLKAGEYWLPEGGFGELALRGVGEIAEEINFHFDIMITACGTGTTMAGLIAAMPESVKILGIAALKGAQFLDDNVLQLLANAKISRSNWQILLDYHCGGFAKTTPDLQHFIRRFLSQHGVALEPIYTGKTLLAVYDLLNRGYFEPGQRIIVLHTGGLQGLRC